MSLESKHYVASPADVESITRQVLDALSNREAGRASYLRALIATTQHELGAEPRQRTTTVDKLTAEGKEKQLAALEAVHTRFYAAVTKAASEKLPPGKERARKLNERTNFARTNLLVVRNWIRAGNDITSLAAAHTNKNALVVALAHTRKRKAPSPKILGNRATKAVDRLAEVVAALAAVDKDAARDALRAAVERLETQLARLGAPTRAPIRARRGHDGGKLRVAA